MHLKSIQLLKNKNAIDLLNFVKTYNGSAYTIKKII